MTQQHLMPAPQPNPETQAFWDATKQGRLLLRRCKACGEVHFYPRTICPFCFSDYTAWLESKGQGTVYAFSVMRRGSPFALAYVTLDEGPTMMTNIVDCDLDAVRIGQKVRVLFRESEGDYRIPVFTLA
ncbi:MAG: Zn-ribbon domain-containing OB-fold protein [Xanthobacteraceae bacterium]